MQLDYRIRWTLCAGWCLVAVACGGAGGDGELTDRQWRQDIDLLATEYERLHPDLFHAVPRQRFVAAVAGLKAEVADLSFNQIFVRIKALVALPAMGMDGHTLVPMFQATGFRVFPLRLYEFSDGVFVIDATTPYRDAIGKRVVQIGSSDLAQINRMLDPLITRDNDATVKFKRTLHYVIPELLEVLGVIDAAEQGSYLLVDDQGTRSTLTVEPIATETYRDVLDMAVGLPARPDLPFLSRPTENFWMQEHPEAATLYVRYRLVQAQTASGLSIERFSGRIAAAVTAADIRKIVVDVRHNGGGNNATFGALLQVLSSAQVDRPGRLYALIDRVTFSAAANFVAALDRDTGALFAGEPTGGSPNNFGDTVAITLPHSGIGLAVPTRYWEFSPGDARLAVAPQIPVEFTAADYFAGRDSVLESVLAR